jgi:hypothetical protein
MRLRERMQVLNESIELSFEEEKEEFTQILT